LHSALLQAASQTPLASMAAVHPGEQSPVEAQSPLSKLQMALLQSVSQ